MSRIKENYIMPLGLFVAIYLPGIRALIISPEYLLMGLFAIWYFLNPNKLRSALLTKPIFWFLFLGILIMLYCFLLELIFRKGGTIAPINLYYFKQLRFLLNAILTCLGFACLLSSMKWDVKKLLDCYVKIAVVQSVIAISMFFIPTLRDYITNSFLNLEFLFEGKEDRLFNRIYGISSEYLLGYPLFQGFTIMVIFMQIIERNYKNLIFVPLILISILFNARIGFISIPIIFFVYFAFVVGLKNRAYRLFNLGIILSVILVVITIAFVVVSAYIDTVLLYEALNRGIDTKNLSSGHLAMLFGDMLHFPSTIQGFIFGEGRYVFGNPNDVQSDMGYVNDILFGGLLYFCLFLFSLYKLFYFKLRRTNYVYRVLMIASFIMLLVSHFKGPVFTNNSFLRGLLILAFLYILTNKGKRGLKNDAKENPILRSA